MTLLEQIPDEIFIRRRQRRDQIPAETLLDDADVMDDRAGMATAVDEIARYQRVAAVLRDYLVLRAMTVPEFALRLGRKYDAAKDAPDEEDQEPAP